MVGVMAGDPSSMMKIAKEVAPEGLKNAAEKTAGVMGALSEGNLDKAVNQAESLSQDIQGVSNSLNDFIQGDAGNTPVENPWRKCSCRK